MVSRVERWMSRGSRLSSSVFSLCLTLGLGLGLGCGGGSPSAPPSPSPTPSRPLAYTALGASDAVGIGAVPLDRGYVYRLADRMRGVRAPVTLRNLGINGAKIEEIVATALPQAIASNPDVVTVWTGSNDIIGSRDPDAFAAVLDTLLARLRAETSALVFVADLADLTRAPLFRIDPDSDVTRARLDAFNARIAAVAAARGCILVRLSQMPIDDGIFAIDGFHPNNAGHERIAGVFWAEIRPRI